MTKAPTRAELIARGTRMLTLAGAPGPGRDARLLMRWASGLEAAAFSARLADPADAREAARFAAGLAARATRRPLSQVIGGREFWGRMFEVTADVLDPRPETETLIAAALAGPMTRVLDLGLGSGCILVTLLAERAQASGVGVERSAAALAVARRNAERHGVAERAELLEGDWWQGVRGRFDLIASNPPYISDEDFDDLAPEVKLWEPLGALAPGGDGLGAYRALAAGLDAALAQGGRALFEFGAGQADAVRAIFEGAGFVQRAMHADMDGRPRCIEIGRR